MPIKRYTCMSGEQTQAPPHYERTYKHADKSFIFRNNLICVALLSSIQLISIGRKRNNGSVTYDWWLMEWLSKGEKRKRKIKIAPKIQQSSDQCMVIIWLRVLFYFSALFNSKAHKLINYGCVFVVDPIEVYTLSLWWCDVIWTGRCQIRGKYSFANTVDWVCVHTSGCCCRFIIIECLNDAASQCCATARVTNFIAYFSWNSHQSMIFYELILTHRDSLFS